MKGERVADRCRSCKEPIRWVRMRKTGKANPLDAEPVEKGNVLIGDDGLGEALGGRRLDDARSSGTTLYVSHWSTCPDRKEWRERTDEKQAQLL